MMYCEASCDVESFIHYLRKIGCLGIKLTTLQRQHVLVPGFRNAILQPL